MASYNRIILVGNLTRDPQLSTTPNDTSICKFGLAINHKWRDRDGNTREEVCFVDCTVFGRRADTFNQYMSKGQRVLVEGRLKLDQWTSPEGDKKSKHEVVVDNFTFLGGGRDGGGQRSTGEYGGGQRSAGEYGGSAAPARADDGGSAAPVGADDRGYGPSSEEEPPF